MSIQNLARPEILEMKAYESARSLIIGDENTCLLDANESSESGGRAGLNRYPEPQSKALRMRFAQIYGLAEENILIGRGSDEAIELLVRTFCRSGLDSILICPPTYRVYEISAAIQGANVIRIPLQTQSFALDQAAIEAKLSADKTKVKIIFICSPNNPTGTAYPKEQLNEICRAAEGRALVVVDEAYGEFADQSMVQEIRRFPNLVILRTLSKAWGLAGLRCGVALGNPDVLNLLQKVRAPYPMSTPVIQAAIEATDSNGQRNLLSRIQKMEATKKWFAEQIADLNLVKRVYPSATNFLLIEFSNAKQVMQTTKQKGIILRDRSHELNLKNCIRVSIGAERDMQRLISVLKELE